LARGSKFLETLLTALPITGRDAPWRVSTDFGNWLNRGDW